MTNRKKMQDIFSRLSARAVSTYLAKRSSETETHCSGTNWVEGRLLAGGSKPTLSSAFLRELGRHPFRIDGDKYSLAARQHCSLLVANFGAVEVASSLNILLGAFDDQGLAERHRF